MKAARMHEYGKALILEDIPVPDIQPEEILVNVKACGMCRSDVQLVDGYFRKYADIPTPISLGHEITGGLGRAGLLKSGQCRIPSVDRAADYRRG
jgi:alcohol dehydrogenase, propanol-preferring